MVADIIMYILLAIGLFFSFVGVLGILRMHDVYGRLQASTCIPTLGNICLMLAGILYAATRTMGGSTMGTHCVNVMAGVFTASPVYTVDIPISDVPAMVETGQHCGIPMAPKSVLFYCGNPMTNMSGISDLKKAFEKNVGFISMKPMAGGAIEDPALAMRYQVSNPDVTLIIPGMAELAEADCNIAAAADTSPLTAEEQEKCQAIRQQLGSQFCRRCNYCAPCTVGIAIPSVFVFQAYVNRYGLGEWATARYNAMAVKPSACIDCGVCETRCPYQLPIRDMLKKAVSEFGQ